MQMHLQQLKKIDIQLKPVSQELVLQLPKWATRKDLQDYFRAWPAVLDWDRPDLIAQRLEWAYGIYENETLIGLVQLCYPNAKAKTIEYGLLIDNQTCSDRIAASWRVEELIRDYIFNVLDYNKIYVRILESRKILLARLLELGYTQEGLLKQSTKIGTEYFNELLLAKFKED